MGNSFGLPAPRSHLEDRDTRLAVPNGDVVETVWTTLITFDDTGGASTLPRAVPAGQGVSTRPREGKPCQGISSEVYARSERLPFLEFGPPWRRGFWYQLVLAYPVTPKVQLLLRLWLRFGDGLLVWY